MCPSGITTKRCLKKKDSKMKKIKGRKMGNLQMKLLEYLSISERNVGKASFGRSVKQDKKIFFCVKVNLLQDFPLT